MWNARNLGGAMPQFLIRDAEAVEVGLQTAVDVALHLHEHIVQRTRVACAAGTATKRAIEARIRTLEQVVDLPQCDQSGMSREHESAHGSAEALDQSCMGERCQYLGDERRLEFARLRNLSCVELGLTIVVDLGQTAQDRYRALCVLPVHRCQCNESGAVRITYSALKHETETSKRVARGCVTNRDGGR